MWSKYYKNRDLIWLNGRKDQRIESTCLKLETYLIKIYGESLKSGPSSVQYANLTHLGALYYVVPINKEYDYQLEEVGQLFSNGEWNMEVMQNIFTEEVCNHLIKNTNCVMQNEEQDKPWWMLTSSTLVLPGNA